MLNYSQEGGQYVLFSFDRNLGNARCLVEKRGENILAAFFISKDRMCYLDANRDVFITSYDGGNQKKWPIMKKGL